VILLTEIEADGGWFPIGRLDPGDPQGSVSDNSGAQRQVICFRLDGDSAVIERSSAGVDIEEGPARRILSRGFECLARLSPGEDYERRIQTDRMAAPVPMRWRLLP